MNRLPAIILAGGRSKPEFIAAAGTEHRALADLNGWPMVRYVITALQQAECIDRIVLVGPPALPRLEGVDRQVDAELDLAGNIAAGLAECGSAEHALLVTADLPFLTPAAVDDYVRACLPLDADLCYAAIPRAVCEERFPAMRRTYLHTPEGSYTGGNVVLQRISAFSRQAEMTRQAYQSRKNPLFLARLIGPGNLAKFVLRRLTLRDIEAAASRVIGVRCRLVETAWAELGSDVDKPDDLALARTLLRPS